jgi:SAM-dependent methyltransferase
MFWFDRQNPDVIYGDNRIEEQILCDGRSLSIKPDVILDFTNLPFEDGSFNLVVFDPPHLHTAGPKSWMAAKYGKLSLAWRDDLKKGFSECFRVLASDGTLIFKWSESQIKIHEVLALTEVKPLFGHPTGRKGLTHWIVFLKPLVNLSDSPDLINPINSATEGES